MDNLHAVFLEEATDLIADLEKSIVALEENPTDQKLIERIFRVMHTFKGNSNMFGFEKIGAFTHELETIYDLVRNGKIAIGASILDLTLASVDHLRKLLQDPHILDQNCQRTHEQLTQAIKSLIKDPVDTQKSPIENPLAENIANPLETSGVKTYYILFRPNPDIYVNGTNVLFLIDELHSLGKCKVTAHINAIPSLEEYDPKVCYTYWDIYLSTNQDENAIRDVFIFVQDRASLEIHKVADEDLLKNQTFLKKIEESTTLEKDVDIHELQNYVNSLLAIIREKTVHQESIKSGSNREANVSSIRVSSEKLDGLMGLVSELVTTQARLSLFADQHGHPELVAIAENFEKISRQLRDNTFSICLIPIENMLTRFQRLVRDLSVELKKEIEFIAEGTETELDKTIIENLADPLLHIFRNSLDHGIEDAAERVKNGKPAKGKIMLKAFYSGTHVHIQIQDDGKGIDPQTVRAKAITKGLISPDAILNDKEILELIFLPGFSTAEVVTEVSGRGVGMDVVKRKISDIRGEVDIASQKGKGTTITIKLPLTLSIIDGLLVKIDDTHFVIPLSAVHKCFQVEQEQIDGAYKNIMVLDGEQYPFLHLRDEFEITQNCPPFYQLVMVKYNEKMVGLIVDHIEGEYQAVLKPLGKLYRKLDIVSGGTILGDGTIALVLDTNKIISQFTYDLVTAE